MRVPVRKPEGRPWIPPKAELRDYQRGNTGKRPSRGAARHRWVPEQAMKKSKANPDYL